MLTSFSTASIAKRKKNHLAEYWAVSLQGWVLCWFNCSGHRELSWGSADLLLGTINQSIDFVPKE